MPPAGVPRPPDVRAPRSCRIWRPRSIARRAASPNPGRPLAHRLNRSENARTPCATCWICGSTRRTMLPADDSSGGFDNNADVLGVSPVLLELSDGGRAGDRARAGRSEDAAGRRSLPRAAGRLAGQARRGAADRHRWRPGPRPDAAARRRVSVPSASVPHEPRHHARPRVRAAARDRGGRRARRIWARSAATRRSPRRATTPRRRATTSMGDSPCACPSRPARATSRWRSWRRRTRSTRGGCRTTSAARPTPSTSRATRTSIEILFTGPFNRQRSRRHAEPPADLRRASPRRRPMRARCATRS